MPVSLKDKVQVLLDTAGSDVVQAFFGSDTPEINKWTDKGSETEVFVKTCEGLNIKYEFIDNHGGEGEGEEYWSVFQFTHKNDSVYVQFNGSYQSYNGADFDEFFFVKPKAVVVTQFFRV